MGVQGVHHPGLAGVLGGGGLGRHSHQAEVRPRFTFAIRVVFEVIHFAIKESHKKIRVGH